MARGVFARTPGSRRVRFGSAANAESPDAAPSSRSNEIIACRFGTFADPDRGPRGGGFVELLPAAPDSSLERFQPYRDGREATEEKHATAEAGAAGASAELAGASAGPKAEAPAAPTRCPQNPTA
jgi:hypothetical protein